MRIFLLENEELFCYPTIKLTIKNDDTFILDSSIPLPYLGNIESVLSVDGLCINPSVITDDDWITQYYKLKIIMSHINTAMFYYGEVGGMNRREFNWLNHMLV